MALAGTADVAFGFSVRSPARGELAYETGQRGPFQKDQVAVPGPGAYNWSTKSRSPAPAGGLMRSTSERSFVSAFASRPDFAASVGASLFPAIGTPHTLAARRSVLRKERDPNWITSPTPLAENAQEIILGKPAPPRGGLEPSSPTVALWRSLSALTVRSLHRPPLPPPHPTGMPGPGSRKGRAVTDYESAARALFAPSTGSTWGGSFSPMNMHAGSMIPCSPIRNSMPLASSRSSLNLGASPSQRSVRLQASFEARQRARTATWC